MLQILKAIKRIIEKFIVNKTSLCDSVAAGATIIPLCSTRRFMIGDVVVIYNQAPNDKDPEGEVHVISDIPNNRSLVIDTPLVDDYPESYSYVSKLIGFESGTETWIDGVYLGDPAVIPRYPAITINGSNRSAEWMTLESIKETYDIDITVYVEAAHFEHQMELMYTYAKAIENSLFRTFYPLVEPYDYATILDTVQPSDTIVHIDNLNFFNCGFGWIFLESYDYLIENKVVAELGNGTYELVHAAGACFEIGSKLIRPRRHIFNTLPKGTQYGTVNKDTMLKAAKISYEVSEERLLRTPFVDPLTF